MTSLSSASLRPLSLARVRWLRSCSVLPFVMSAATVIGLRSRLDSSVRYSPRLGRHIRVEHWANARRQGAVAAKAMLGQDAVDVRPSYFFTDQYDLSMEYTGDIGPAGYDRVIFRRYADSGQMIVFWLYEQRILAGMNIDIWDVADDIERLIQSARPVNADDLGNPAIPVATL
jgi:3-phenylpropionate/trans-cinnamate dioxygenase ferredoxin reductase component